MTRRLLILLAAALLWLTARCELPSDTIRLGQTRWQRTAVTLGVRMALNSGITASLKHYVDKTRPDGSDRRSFPSRHSLWAFSIGGTVTCRLAARSPWWGVASQAAASAVGFQRVIDRRHYPEDVLAGAAIGIADNAVANIVASLIFGPANPFPGWRATSNTLSRSLSASTGIDLPLRHDWGSVHIGPSLLSEVTFTLPMSARWGFTASAALRSAPVSLRGKEAPAVGVVSGISAQIGAVASTSFGGSPLALAGFAAAGYLHRLGVDGADIRRSSYIATAGADLSLTLTPAFALGLRPAMTLSASPVKGYSPLASTSISIYSRANF